ncbi:hypothetical protein XA68_17725 [Ophiocordyceps unilateralis]|uniref:DUF6987 domain-containing protein n=1 Tax=Ophiocordyceps unilateralis TaxID=268505 RepID=A0A2A9P441_OPHUN|nr:hypothetical protein XA68_17725 [Ophiocordyceps unilateralis]
MPIKNAFSVPGSWGKDTGEGDTTSAANSEAIPRNAAGVVDKSGKIVDESGKTVGNISDSKDAEALAGSAVTATGDVINASGEILGKASLESEYTTKSDSKSGGGWNVLGKTKGVIQTVDNIRGPVNKSFELANNLPNLPGKAAEKGTSGVNGGDDESAATRGEQKDGSTGRKDAVADSAADSQKDVKDGGSGVESQSKPAEASTSRSEKTASVADTDQRQPRIQLEDNDKATDQGTAKRESPTSAASTAGKYDSEVKSSADDKVNPESDAAVSADHKTTGEEPLRMEDPVPVDEESETGVKSEPLKPADSVSEVASKSAGEPAQGRSEKAPSALAQEHASEKGSKLASEQAKSTEHGMDEAPSEMAGNKTAEIPPSEQISNKAEGHATSKMVAEKTPGETPSEPHSKRGTWKATSELAPEQLTGEASSDVAAGKTEEKIPSELHSEKATHRATSDLAPEKASKQAQSELGDKSTVKDASGTGPEPAEGKAPEPAELTEGKAPSALGSEKVADEAPSDVGSQKPLETAKQATSELGSKKEPSEVARGGLTEEALSEVEGKPEADQGTGTRSAAPDAHSFVGSEGKADVSGSQLEEPEAEPGQEQDDETLTKEVAEEGDKTKEAPLDYSLLKGTKVNKSGNLVDSDGDVIGRLVEGDAKKLRGKLADEEGYILDDSGNKVGRGEPLPDAERPQEEGKDNEVLTEEEKKENEAGQGEEEEEPPLDYSVLKGTKVNKSGNLVDGDGDIIGRLVEGDAKQLIGRRADADGYIWNDSGKKVGRGEPIPAAERDAAKSFAPFENFPDAVVEADGRVMSEGRQVGTVVEGDPKRLKGSKVDEDGDILDRRGNIVGKAEAWDEPEPPPEEEPEPPPDRSILAGKRVNKMGNVVDSAGVIYGRVVEGNVASLVGRMCNRDGNVMSESGEVIGRAELVPEHEREGTRDGPFAELVGCTVTRDGKVVTAAGDVVGRLTSGDGKMLYGRSVDEDGDVVDRNGNVLGKAERWEEPVVEKKRDALAGRKVNREGNVVDEDGNIIGRLTSGDVGICAGKEIDDDGDVINSKGMTIGHVSRLEDIPPEVEPEPEPEEPEESAEDKEKREQAEQDRKLAGQLSAAIEQSLDKIRPVCRMIMDKIERAERTPKEELDEEQLVREVKPLIEEGGRILTETNGTIRGLDPDGRIQRNAKAKAGTREATPEEHHLAEVLKELTGTVSETIDKARRKIDGMPHAKKELNPLWGLLSEPLFQILAAVGLLLNGVLGIVGRLLSGLGLGGLVDNLLGGLGLNKILGSLGLGSALDALTGKKKK